VHTKVTNAHKSQMVFIEDDAVFPSTRFQGSKLKLVDWIWDAIKDLEFDTALDAFGGTGCVGHMLKARDKEVTYNDVLKFNWYIGTALIENDATTLLDEDVEWLLEKKPGRQYPTFVQDTFADVYFSDEENQWIDTVVTNISRLADPYKKALSYFALFQACIIKRPFNLFHRKNLYLRFSDVKRNFGNKSTWDASFETHFKQFVGEANQGVFSNGRKNRALNLDVFDVQGTFDLVYIDTPYISKKGTGVDYLGFYHFLEGLVNYSKWSEMIDYNTKHKRLKRVPCVWCNKDTILSGFDRLFGKFRDSIIVVSYRSDGIPSVGELLRLLKKYKLTVDQIRRKNYRYVLSTNHSEEVLLIGI
jgi:adenine-specific DNA-methyltransferase